MKSSIALLLLAVVASASANRVLLQAPAGANLTGTPVGINVTLGPAPAPAPGPSSCPAKQSPASTCVTEATSFQTACASYISALNSATGGKVTATTEQQITGLVAQLKAAGQTPSATCCPVAISLLNHACACDASVQAVAKARQNLSPSEFQTVGNVFLHACGQPACIDTCQLSA